MDIDALRLALAQTCQDDDIDPDTPYTEVDDADEVFDPEAGGHAEALRRAAP